MLQHSDGTGQGFVVVAVAVVLAFQAGGGKAQVVAVVVVVAFVSRWEGAPGPMLVARYLHRWSHDACRRHCKALTSLAAQPRILEMEQREEDRPHYGKRPINTLKEVLLVGLLACLCGTYVQGCGEAFWQGFSRGVVSGLTSHQAAVPSAKPSDLFCVRHRTRSGWSKGYNVPAHLVEGSELARDIPSQSFENWSKYVVIFWTSGQATFINMGISMLSIGPIEREGVDLNGATWAVSKGGFCPATPHHLYVMEPPAMAPEPAFGHGPQEAAQSVTASSHPSKLLAVASNCLSICRQTAEQCAQSCHSGANSSEPGRTDSCLSSCRTTLVGCRGGCD